MPRGNSSRSNFFNKNSSQTRKQKLFLLDLNRKFFSWKTMLMRNRRSWRIESDSLLSETLWMPIFYGVCEKTSFSWKSKRPSHLIQDLSSLWKIVFVLTEVGSRLKFNPAAKTIRWTTLWKFYRLVFTSRYIEAYF